MIHQTGVKKYEGTLNDLATDIGDLRYDVLSEFLELLIQFKTRQKLFWCLNRQTTFLIVF